ncbi:hypothetical protein F4780DRAFT_753487 [Xylariomycetidae sp. FL0641]|nr:hypothetical protein F4780DRAFT_753487 [Xylariomycetidae sp. FL0641]
MYGGRLLVTVFSMISISALGAAEWCIIAANTQLVRCRYHSAISRWPLREPFASGHETRTRPSTHSQETQILAEDRVMGTICSFDATPISSREPACCPSA